MTITTKDKDDQNKTLLANRDNIAEKKNEIST